MNVVFVKFSNYGKAYAYKTKLHFIRGAKYKIMNASGNTYNDAIVECINVYEGVQEIFTQQIALDTNSLKEIIAAECVDAPKPKTLYQIKNIYENYDKGVTTVLWTDGDVTMLHLQDGDEYDLEKVIALAYMKKHFDNRGCFNDEIKKWTKILDERWLAQYDKDVAAMVKKIEEEKKHEIN